MSYEFGLRSRQRLSGVNPKLVQVMDKAISLSKQDFSVIEGIRSLDRQKVLVREGKSQTLKSKHITGNAVDVVSYPVSWEWEAFYPIADAVIAAAKECDVHMRWGGNWQVKDLREWEGTAQELVEAYTGKFYDLPHFELM